MNPPSWRITPFVLLSAIAVTSGCAVFRGEPPEPLAEAIPQAPGLSPQFAHPTRLPAEPPERPKTQAAVSDQDAQSREVQRRIEEVKRQRRELEKITEEIKALIKAAPRQP